MRILDRTQVERLLPIETATGLMAEAMRRYSAGLIDQPLRTILRPQRDDGLLGTMPCHVAPSGPDDPLHGYGVKAMVLKPDNPRRGLDLHNGLVVVFDPETGAPLALMDAGAVTAVRTAAVSAVATDALAAEDCETLAILGAGVQARAHLRAMLHVRPGIKKLRTWSRTPEHARAFAEWAGGVFGGGVEVAEEPGAAVTGADLVCSTLACREPVVRAAHLADGVHVNAVGASFRDHREYFADAVARAALFVDSRQSALSESGDIAAPLAQGLIGPEHILAELGEILLGRHPGRTRADQITLYKSLGLAAQDVVAGLAIARAAQAQQVGFEVALS